MLQLALFFGASAERHELTTKAANPGSKMFMWQAPQFMTRLPHSCQEDMHPVV
jgi:hypothetical protein